MRPRGPVAVGAVDETLTPARRTRPVLSSSVSTGGSSFDVVPPHLRETAPARRRPAASPAGRGSSSRAGRPRRRSPRSKKCPASRATRHTLSSASGTGSRSTAAPVAATSVNRPSGSRRARARKRPPAGRGSPSVIPARARATLLATAECPSQRRTKTGWVADTRSRSCRVGCGPSG